MSPELAESPPSARTPMSERQQMALLLQITSPDSDRAPAVPSHSASSAVTSSHTPPSSVACAARARRSCPTSLVQRRNRRGETPLHVASIRGDVRRVRQLIAQGADVDATDFAGWTPLHEACNHGWLSVVAVLLRAGACVNSRGPDDVTPLHDAAVSAPPLASSSAAADRRQLVRLLLRAGADCDARTADGRTPLELCSSPRLERLLLRHQRRRRRNKQQQQQSSSSSDEDKENLRGSCGRVRSGSSSRASPLIGTRLVDRIELVNNQTSNDMESEQCGTTIDVSAISASINKNDETPQQQQHVDCDKTDNAANTPSPCNSVSVSGGGGSGELSPSSTGGNVDGGAQSGRSRSPTDKEVTASGGGTSCAVETGSCDAATSAGKRSASHLSVDQPTTGGAETTGDEGSKRRKKRDDACVAMSKAFKNGDKSSKSGGKPGSGGKQHRASSCSAVASDLSRRSPVNSPSKSRAVSVNNASDDSDETEARPKVPPLKIVINSGGAGAGAAASGASSGSGGASSGASSAAPDCVDSSSRLPYVVNPQSCSSDVSDMPAASCADNDAHHKACESRSNEDTAATLSASCRRSPDATLACSDVGIGADNKSDEACSSTVGSDETKRTDSPTLSSSSVDPLADKARQDPTDITTINSSSAVVVKDSTAGASISATAGGANAETSCGVTTSESSSIVGSVVCTASMTLTTSTTSSVSGCPVLMSPSTSAAAGCSSVITQSSSSSCSSSSGTAVDAVPPRKRRYRHQRSHHQHHHHHPASSSTTVSVTSPVLEDQTTASSGAANDIASNSATTDLATSAATNIDSSSGPPQSPSRQHQQQRQSPTPPFTNNYKLFAEIRRQVERRRRELFPISPKPPRGFKDYLLNRGTYVLAGNAQSRLSAPCAAPPMRFASDMVALFDEQELERYQLRVQHIVEKEKLVLAVEQEILRVHGRAARALANQAVPFSACSMLKHEEVYNLATAEQDDKDRNVRDRYNGRQFFSWLQDVDDKWEKIKEAMILRHHNEAEALHAVQKMNWVCKLREVGECDARDTPAVHQLHVPMVQVIDDFDMPSS